MVSTKQIVESNRGSVKNSTGIAHAADSYHHGNTFGCKAYSDGKPTEGNLVSHSFLHCYFTPVTQSQRNSPPRFEEKRSEAQTKSNMAKPQPRNT